MSVSMVLLNRDEVRLALHAVKVMTEMLKPGMFGLANSDVDKQLTASYLALGRRLDRIQWYGELATTAGCSRCDGAGKIFTVNSSSKVTAWIICDRCQGTGEVDVVPSPPCKHCQGSLMIRTGSGLVICHHCAGTGKQCTRTEP